MSDFQLNFPSPDGQNIERSISSGEILFLVGANGTGKSTIMHRFATQNTNRVRRITAHRQVWFSSNTVDLTPHAREQSERNISSRDQQEDSRWRDDHAAQRSQVTIFDLIDSENVQARDIAEAARSDDLDKVKVLALKQSPIQILNDILRISNLDIQIKVDKGSKLTAKRNGHPEYSIAELSDGERNAIIIITNVLTAPPETLILLDEPERHLHRSIVSPLISTLLAHRQDCAFVISTHDVSLPLDQKKASSLLIRSYNHQPKYWVTDYIGEVENLDDTTALAILGAREKILFIEGKSSSLDIQIYQLLFPNISIKPIGSCVDVERAVRGIRAAEGHHWISAFGIIDKDNRSTEECEKLVSDGIAPLDQYSVESIYYHPETVQGVLDRVAEINGIDKEKAFESMGEGILRAFEEHKERMVARMVERKVIDNALYNLPNWKNILKGNVEVKISTQEFVENENKIIDEMLNAKDIAALISRYPVRETPALESISKSLGFRSQDDYEQAVRKMLIDSEEKRQTMRSLIQPISDLISAN